ncbi:homoserine O-acetyltransferase MetX [Fundidesulfovibrio terrae]|uniref:homoserine O-acetyltransferase MetX n=1 Tax=Fundidesulfovibrio terrae TaxID=2922866 RepID=UPI001FAEA19D|nr:homoserine O-acetyltransferase [Fundidesulfovibrio terrae]
MSEYAEHSLDDAGEGLVEKKSFTFAQTEPFPLESGASIGPVTLAYETYGRLAPDGSNAVLVCHALTGDSHAAGVYSLSDPKPGWWEVMVGPGKGIDTDKYFVVCANVLGGCMGSTGPASIDPATGKPYGISFPVLTIGDMVRAQKVLLEHLGVTRLLSVIGGSMGGMQVLEWAARYPDMAASAIALATAARHSALHIAFHEVARQAILADPDWNGGDYYASGKPEHGLAVARMIGHITYLSDEAMRHKFGRGLQDRADFSFSFDADFQVESYLRYQGRKFVERFDANSFLYITRAADYFDLGATHGKGSLTRAFSRGSTRFLVVSFSSDWLYPTYQSRELVQALKRAGKDVSFCEIEAQWGHDAFLLDSPRLAGLISGHLERTRRDMEKGLI